MTLTNLESLIAIVTPKDRRAEEAFGYPENASRRWTDHVLTDHTDTELLITRRASKAAAAWPTPAVHLHLHLTLRPKNLLKGFIFGTDETTCDVLLQRSRASGISGNHFSIQIDWDSGSPMLSCLSERGIRLKEESTGKYVRTLFRDDGETVPSGATLLVEVIDRFELTICCPERGRLQPVYNENLQDYYRKYKDAVPDVSNMFLDRPDMTPFILHRCIGLNGGEYYTTQRMITGDAEYDEKVFLYHAKIRPAADEIGRISGPEPEPILQASGKQAERRPIRPNTTRSQNNVEGSNTAIEPFLDNAKSQVCIVKHFRDKQGVCSVTPLKAQRWNRLQHLNILRVFDIILEGTAFLVVNEYFLHITLDSILRDAATLSLEESGFIIGQMFDGLNYLHEQGWVHGNVDPRSVLVVARNPLLIKLADTALSAMANLGKPDGYHDLYASQRISAEFDQYPSDIWSAGVVGLHLVHGRLPERATYTLSSRAQYVQQLVIYIAARSRQQLLNDGLRFLKTVMKARIKDRPTAKDLLKDPWIQKTRHYQALQSRVTRLATPQGLRHTSAGPSNSFNRQSAAGPSNHSIVGEYAPGSHYKSVGPSYNIDRQGPVNPSKPIDCEEYVLGSRHTSVGPSGKGLSTNLSRQSSTDPAIRALLESHPYPGDDYNDFESENGSTTSRSSRFTANSLARLARAPTPYESDGATSAPVGQCSLRSQSRSNGGRSPANQSEHASTASQSSRFTDNPLARQPHFTRTPYDSEDESGMPGRLGSLRSQPRSSGLRSPAIDNKHGGPGPLRSQPRGKSPLSDWATGTFGPVEGQGEALIEEDSGEETATDERRGRVTKKPRRDAVVPPLERNLRSRGNGRR